MSQTYRAVLWDFGGVILSSPFNAFNTYEQEHGLPRDFVRSVNAHNPDSNAWARLERGELTHEDFDRAFTEESTALGHEVPGRDILGLLAGKVRPQMVAALDAVIAAGYKTACLTNNVASVGDRSPTANERPDTSAVMAKFDAVVESSKVNVRKPEPEFYRRGCALIGVEPAECVYLDDLGVNLKPARQMGMTTIKVLDPDVAISELGEVLGLDLRTTSDLAL